MLQIVNHVLQFSPWLNYDNHVVSDTNPIEFC